MENNKMIFSAYLNENGRISLGISPEFQGYTNGKEYFINLGDTLLKMKIEQANKIEAISKEGEE